MTKFSTRVIKWQKKSGRKNLPWQIDRSPYRVWISEIMLQQTQVSSAIPYFNKFMDRFPSIESLAASNQDEVLSYWSGLGYYARARNIHKAAKIVKKEYSSILPSSTAELEMLPGIGKSTAGAIIALSLNKRAPILDGNVKRILSRYYRIQGDLKSHSSIKSLWDLSEELLPKGNYDIFTQGIMDLGATVCKRSQPSCSLCPVNNKCLAYKHNETSLFPNKSLTKPKPKKKFFWLVAISKGNQFYLEKRHNKGIWGGLFSFMEFSTKRELETACKNKFQIRFLKKKPTKKIQHRFSHFNLEANIMAIEVNHISNINSNIEHTWIRQEELQSIGVPAPVRKLIIEMSK
jgi:A/G-specific adenine glycosylase